LMPIAPSPKNGPRTNIRDGSLQGGQTRATDLPYHPPQHGSRCGPDLYQTFKSKKDGCVKVVFHPAS
jgi:hypothetical protein